MIPLLKPLFPNLRSVEKIFSPAFKTRQYSNFGEIFDSCVEALSFRTGGRALPVLNGTVAITVALSALKMRGKRVAVPDYTHSGTLLAVIQAGAIPVLHKVNEKTWIIDPDLVDHKNIDCVIAVSPFGYFLDINDWENWSSIYNKPVVYDLAGAWGYFPKTKNIRCYSFHSTKNFGVGEGGCVVASTEELWETCRRITNFETLPDRSVASIDGFNGKVDELRCALILSMLSDEMSAKIGKVIQNKQALLIFYQEQLDAYCPPGPKKPSLCVLGKLPAGTIEREGQKNGITFKTYFPLLSRMPGLKSVERFSESNDDMLECLALPSSVSLCEAYRIVDFVLEFL